MNAAPTLGIDLGTSGVKALLLDGERMLATAHAPLAASRPRRLVRAGAGSLVGRHLRLPRRARGRTSGGAAAVRAIGLAGQMHGATLVDADGQVLRPCILWDDGRSAPQCAQLEAAVPALRAIAGNLAMPGFTAPKLLWVRQHEPAVFARTRRVLLPEAWLRWKLCGESSTTCPMPRERCGSTSRGRRWSRRTAGRMRARRSADATSGRRHQAGW